MRLDFSVQITFMHKLLQWLLTHPEGERRVSEPAIRYAADEEATVLVDRARMERALESESHDMPSGLSREEKRKRILAVASRHQ